MFASTFLSRLTVSSTPSQPLLPVSATTKSLPPAAPYTDIPTTPSSPTDTTATLLALARQEAHLQSHIQYLLDVQSDRLLEGLGGDTPTPPHPPNANRASNYHNTTKRTGIADSRSLQPVHTLQGARKQIGTAIADLYALKLQNAEIVGADLATARRERNRIASIQTRRTELERTIRELEASPLSAELDALAAEDESLGQQISELEDRLFEMRARRGVVRQRVREGRNRVEARVSSWRGSLEMVGKEEGEMLRRERGKNVVGGVVLGEGGKGVWDLPIARRTLGMVGEFYEGLEEGLGTRLRGVEGEVRALEEGGRVWGDVVMEVGVVESMLEGEMKGLGERDGGDDDGDERRIEGMKRVLDAMARARETIGGKLEMAEEKGWNLLVVCIGAELEALVEGEQVLRSVLGVEGGIGDGERDVGTDAGDGSGREGERGMEGGKGMVEDTEDDEPGPELLLSTQEEDAHGK
ncbi:MAG: hypothetical protein LQ339_000457 [Xanthoria mediterranea]|nr:MAG: hypothetical protein LQ339_000457 [Xanthoria mediterranea]